jgi:ABC-type branched-subunit amino acid transport system ATPase component
MRRWTSSRPCEGVAAAEGGLPLLGQQQLAIARALVTRPRLLADESVRGLLSV